ncbi:MAG: hypothetical protein KAI83_17335, partial [Thiomargarita sp.]|nr:hypothetical protein [Thiomargarita sp.]
RKYSDVGCPPLVVALNSYIVFKNSNCFTKLKSVIRNEWLAVIIPKNNYLFFKKLLFFIIYFFAICNAK